MSGIYKRSRGNDCIVFFYLNIKDTNQIIFNVFFLNLKPIYLVIYLMVVGQVFFVDFFVFLSWDKYNFYLKNYVIQNVEYNQILIIYN